MRGFTNVAFPIVRRVFGGLIANDLVSIQPMSLPSGLLFYLDYTSGARHGAHGANSEAISAGDSLYNSPTGAKVRTGSTAKGGKYDLGGLAQSRNMRSKAALTTSADQDSHAFHFHGDGAVVLHTNGAGGALDMNLVPALAQKLVQFDAQVLEDNANGQEISFVLIPLTSDNFADLDTTMVKEIALVDAELGDPGALTHFRAVPEDNQSGNCLLYTSPSPRDRG